MAGDVTHKSDRSDDLPHIFSDCLGLLAEMYDSERAVFSYSTSLADGGYVNDFEHPLYMRYTINTLLGLYKLDQHWSFQWDVADSIETFLARNIDDVTNVGDQGLLLYLLARMGHDRLPGLYTSFVTDEVLSAESLGPKPVQELCWMLLGLTACARAGVGDAESRAKQLFTLLKTEYLDKRSLFIRHDLRPVRRDFVSFGAMVYFLKSWAEYADAFDDQQAGEIVATSTRSLMDCQLDDGGWPWFYHVPSGKVMDVYEVYGVHQDAMSMLFLFPARDLGVEGIDEATRRSVQWLFGHNDVGQPMINEDPFLIYRSIRRRGGAERAKRFLRGVTRGPLGLTAGQVNPSKLEINPECRSYHIGWLIYAWADQTDPDGWFKKN